ncbi:hypothetical protein NK8_19910 [Caballeronia sp. NK8]|nr:hypothetical protein NK8_19910 [Caballeronia sp. NK8]
MRRGGAARLDGKLAKGVGIDGISRDDERFAPPARIGECQREESAAPLRASRDARVPRFAGSAHDCETVRVQAERPWLSAHPSI